MLSIWDNGIAFYGDQYNYILNNSSEMNFRLRSLELPSRNKLRMSSLH